MIMPRIETIDFTRNFIDELTARIERDYISKGRDMGRLAVVFGGKRPSHFLRRSLARCIGKGFVPPVFYTQDGFMGELAAVSGTSRAAGELDDCHELYELIGALAPELLEGRGSFAKFLPWASDILDLIQQLDLEDVDPAALRNIEDSARIGYPVPENINRLLQKILVLRESFHGRLLAQGRLTRGMTYLKAKKNVASWDAGRFDEIIFANFFYFHRTEEAVVRSLAASGKATLIFQGDERKWPVLKHVASRFGCELKEGEQPTPTEFELKAYSAFDVHGEAALVRDILGKIPRKDRAVIVLPDTGALVPLLSTLGEDVKDFNVSMGYPLKRGSLYLLLQAVFRAQISRRGARYYTKDYLAVMRHPFVKNLRLSRDPVVIRVLAHKLEEVLKGRIAGRISGKLFIALGEVLEESVAFEEAAQTLDGMGIRVSCKELVHALGEVHEVFFGPWEKALSLAALADALGLFLDVMAHKSSMGRYPLNASIMREMSALTDQLKRASFSGEIFEPEELFRVVDTLIGKALVSFSGTPLKGLQVLGLFETRSLSFDHVIMMDVNEGILPKIDVRASIIPREVMGRLSLDRLELEEEIQRYQFMRIISSAKTVHLVYQKNKEKAPSRFLEELVWDVQKARGELAPYPTARASFPVRVSGRPCEAVKTPKMLEFLRSFSYSASSINAYVANPYTFYMNYVLGLREEEDLLDEPDAAMVGNVLHRFLEEVYKPFTGKALVLDDVFEKKFWAVFERHFNETFNKRMRSDAFLVHGVMRHKLHAFLEHERERAPGIARLVAVEEDFEGIIPLSVGGIRFRSRIDRIEKGADGRILVLDYKTGASDKLPVKKMDLGAQPSREEIFRQVRSFQLPLYRYFVGCRFPGARIDAGLYSLREMKTSWMAADNDPAVSGEDPMKPYLTALDRVVAEILDPAVPFKDDELKNMDF